MADVFDALSQLFYMLAMIFAMRCEGEYFRGLGAYYNTMDDVLVGCNPGQQVMGWGYCMPEGDGVVEGWMEDYPWVESADPSDLYYAMADAHQDAEQALSETLEEGATVWEPFIDQGWEFYEKSQAYLEAAEAMGAASEVMDAVESIG